jgi:hypothetical protein
LPILWQKIPQSKKPKQYSGEGIAHTTTIKYEYAIYLLYKVLFIEQQ